jgi:hypothetical protein
MEHILREGEWVSIVVINNDALDSNCEGMKIVPCPPCCMHVAAFMITVRKKPEYTDGHRDNDDEYTYSSCMGCMPYSLTAYFQAMAEAYGG